MTKNAVQDYLFAEHFLAFIPHALIDYTSHTPHDYILQYSLPGKMNEYWKLKLTV